MSDIVLWGFDGSTYVRTLKMVRAEKGVLSTSKAAPNGSGRSKNAGASRASSLRKVRVDQTMTRGDALSDGIAFASHVVIPGKRGSRQSPRMRADDFVIGLMTRPLSPYPRLAAFICFPISSAGKTTQCERTASRTAAK